MWCIDDDEQRRIRPQPPYARRVPAEWRRLLRCCGLPMSPHRLRPSAWHTTPLRSERDPLYFYHGLLERGGARNE